MKPLKEAMHRYLNFIQSEGKSPATVKTYHESLHLLFGLCPDLETYADVTKESVQEYKAQLNAYTSLHGKPLSITSKNHHLTILRAFIQYLIVEEEIKMMPPDRVRLYKLEDRKPKFLSEEEIDRLMKAPSPDTIIGIRDRAILQLFYSTGMRVAELRKVNRREVNYETKEMSIRGKGRKVRVVFLTAKAVSALKKYLESRLDHLTPLFIRDHSKAQETMPPGENYRLSDVQLYNIVVKYARKAGIASLPSPHTLRHSFATTLLRNGADMRSVQELLGHKDIKTTQVYTHLTNPYLKDIHTRFHNIKDSKKEN